MTSLVPVINLFRQVLTGEMIDFIAKNAIDVPYNLLLKLNLA